MSNQNVTQSLLSLKVRLEGLEKEYQKNQEQIQEFYKTLPTNYKKIKDISLLKETIRKDLVDEISSLESDISSYVSSTNDASIDFSKIISELSSLKEFVENA